MVDSLPVELIHHILSYFTADEIFYTFMNVTSYIDAILLTYSCYRINFKSISRTNFNLICKHIIPNQVTTLTLSNDENTPGLGGLFLSRFQIQQFIHLQSLTLIDIGPDLWENIVTQLIHLKRLCSFSYINLREAFWKSNLSGTAITQIDIDLFNSYAPVLSHLYRLRLCHGDFFESVQFPNLRHLILERSSINTIKHISSVAPQLKSLDTKIQCHTLSTKIIYPLLQLTRLTLVIDDFVCSINDIERMMSNLPRLKHLTLTASCHNNVIDGHRLQIKMQHLITFNFRFNLFSHLESEDLNSFRTSFWLEEKQWFVAYGYQCLFSVPYFNTRFAKEYFQFPVYSTVPNNKIFSDCIDTLDLSETVYNVDHQYMYVKTLTLCYPVILSSIERIVNLNGIQHFILLSMVNNFPIIETLDKMPNLRQISLSVCVKYFLKEIRSKTLENIRILTINPSYMDDNDYNIEKLSIVFPNIEHLYVKHICVIAKMFSFLDRFKYLSTASFQYMPQSLNDVTTRQHCLTIQSALDRIRRIQRFHYIYQLDYVFVYFWL
ncbi:unnamed protein product [Adineta steineri]|uniref:F-box domain-containing protein n=2 Tax=Adineta steineri TaxID=433720 RepID=A0A813MNL0_9BILA|nr:unnamed protein product [Adineta steineri]